MGKLVNEGKMRIISLEKQRIIFDAIQSAHGATFADDFDIVVFALYGTPKWRDKLRKGYLSVCREFGMKPLSKIDWEKAMQ